MRTLNHGIAVPGFTQQGQPLSQITGGAMAEMSGRFLASGRELTVEEYEELLISGKKRRVEGRIEQQKMSFFWLGHALGLPTSFNLSGMLRQIGMEGSAFLYNEPQVIEKSEGGTRIIISPKAELMFVQKRINRLLLHTFKSRANTFGYMGGTCYDVASRHANYVSTLKFDVKDAFFQISFDELKTALTGFRPHRPGFSRSIAHWITQLCVYSPPPDIVLKRFRWMRSFLPQGAPTSPICFHLACEPLDGKLIRVAERVGGIVSRYADNYYFSMRTSRFSEKLERMIVCDAQKRGFPIHKVRTVKQGELCRILGYNLNDGRITNTRDFNRNLRGALHVLRTKLDRGLEWQDAYARVRGFMGVSVNLPDGLRQTYEYCESRIAGL